MKKEQIVFGICGAAIFFLFQYGNPLNLFFGKEEKEEIATDTYRTQIMDICPERYEQFSALLRVAKKNEKISTVYPFDTYSEKSVELYQKMAEHFIKMNICPERLPAADAPDGEKRLIAKNVEKVKQLCPGAEKDFGYILKPQIDGLYIKESAILFFDIANSYYLNGFCIDSFSNTKEKKTKNSDSQVVVPQNQVEKDLIDPNIAKKLQDEFINKNQERIMREQAREKARNTLKNE